MDTCRAVPASLTTERGREGERIRRRRRRKKLKLRILLEVEGGFQRGRRIGQKGVSFKMTDTRRRVKLYELNAERQWDDKGTGEIYQNSKIL